MDRKQLVSEVQFFISSFAKRNYPEIEDKFWKKDDWTWWYIGKIFIACYLQDIGDLIVWSAHHGKIQFEEFHSFQYKKIKYG